MSIEGRSVLAAIALAVLGGRVACAADSCGAGCPKAPSNARAVSTLFPVPLPMYPTPVLTAGLARGQRRTMLNVEATIATSALALGTPLRPALFIESNGIPMEPLSGGVGTPLITDCSTPPPFSCTLSGTFWLDLDQNPTLVGMPITVALIGGAFGGLGVGVPVTATMTVRLTKK